MSFRFINALIFFRVTRTLFFHKFRILMPKKRVTNSLFLLSYVCLIYCIIQLKNEEDEGNGIKYKKFFIPDSRESFLIKVSYAFWWVTDSFGWCYTKKIQTFTIYNQEYSAVILLNDSLISFIYLQFVCPHNHLKAFLTFAKWNQPSS